MPVLWTDLFHDIERDRKVLISWIKVDDIIDSIRGNSLDELLSCIAVRINKGDAMPLLDILDSQILEEVSLPHTGLTDDVHMSAPIILLDTKDALRIAEVGLGKKGNVVLCTHKRLFKVLSRQISRSTTALG